MNYSREWECSKCGWHCMASYDWLARNGTPQCYVCDRDMRLTPRVTWAIPKGAAVVCEDIPHTVVKPSPLCRVFIVPFHGKITVNAYALQMGIRMHEVMSEGFTIIEDIKQLDFDGDNFVQVVMRRP